MELYAGSTLATSRGGQRVEMGRDFINAHDKWLLYSQTKERELKGVGAGPSPLLFMGCLFIGVYKYKKIG